MIYLNVEDLGWKPFIQSWMAKKDKQQQLVPILQKLLYKYMDPVLEHKRLFCKVICGTRSSHKALELCFHELCMRR